MPQLGSWRKGHGGGMVFTPPVPFSSNLQFFPPPPAGTPYKIASDLFGTFGGDGASTISGFQPYPGGATFTVVKSLTIQLIASNTANLWLQVVAFPAATNWRFQYLTLAGGPVAAGTAWDLYATVLGW